MGSFGLGELQAHAAKTAAYTVVPKDLGTFFTTEGATTAITFTLPAVADIQAGWWCEFFAAEDVNLVVASAEGDNMCAFNDVAADSVAFQTAGEIVGGSFKLFYNGTTWNAVVRPSGSHASTVTVAT